MIQIKNIEKTVLDEKAIRKLIRKFSKTKKEIYLTFDSRIGSFGSYYYNCKKKRHEIKISSKEYNFGTVSAKTYEIIATILHEIKHLQQQESLGTVAFYSKKVTLNKHIKGAAAANYYSEQEIEARVFEEKNTLAAVEFYWKSCKDMLG